MPESRINNVTAINAHVVVPSIFMFTLTDPTRREDLREGRDYGIGFALAKRIKKNLRLVQPLSPCKDYLNDVVYSEHTGKDYSAHGLKATKQGIFEDGAGFLVFGICHYPRGSPYRGFNDDLDYLDEHLDELRAFISFFEVNFKLTVPSVFHKIKDNRFLCITTPFWYAATYKISLLSSLIRMAVEGKYGVDPERPTDPLGFIANCQTSDWGNRNRVTAKVKMMMDGIIPKQDFTEGFDAHESGICNFLFPSESRDNLKQEDEDDDQLPDA